MLQQIYSMPIRENLVAERVRKIKQQNVICAASVTPANTKRLAPIAKEAGLDILVDSLQLRQQSTTRKANEALSFPSFVNNLVFQS